ncbi:TetR/AcrR family transcriptional regulator [Streptomyces lydicamycinicus]|uniref:TetR/AcrR family transcriptional regulator n=1 Tax=Streptomyces lydicamycinicus TaxID=1546107 RepID=UPI002035AFF9|nr:TetR/AcrR family transcriptional regulator [Streptomyces lydicamycinicus]USA03975.1 TetR/AcrR family transcriptional regulator [Streptomyces lydicamycinicus]
MQTRRYHHGDLRAALLTRAEQTLREKGPGALSLRELARDLGVSHAAPSRHFKDKQALLDALALAGFDRLDETLAASREPDATFADRLGGFVRAYVDFAVANAQLIDLMYTIKHDPAASEALVKAAQRLGAMAEEVVAEGQRAGEVREGPVDSIAIPVFTTLHGFASFAMSRVLSPEEVASGLDAVIAYMLRGCAP